MSDQFYPPEDRRRRQYVPIAVHFGTGMTGNRIQKDYGLEGLGVWALLIAACKRSPVQGTFIWLGEGDAWMKLGIIAGREPAFTFEDFVTTLGKIRQARTRRVGGQLETTLTRFFDWNNNVRRESEAERKRRKRAQNTADDAAPILRTIVRTEGEGEYEEEGPLENRAKNQPQNGQVVTPTAAPSRPVPQLEPDGTFDYQALMPANPIDLRCPICGTRQGDRSELEDHIHYLHWPDEPVTILTAAPDQETTP